MERSKGSDLAHQHLELLRRTIRHKIRRVVGRYGILEAEREDLEQEAFADATKRLEHFDEAISKIHTFIDRVVTNYVATHIEYRRRLRRDSRRVSHSVDDAQEVCAAKGDSPDLNLDIAEALTDEPDLRRHWEHLLLNSVSELARATERERGDLRGVLTKLRRRFKDANLEIYLTNLPPDAVDD